jgi:hypothetical protein
MAQARKRTDEEILSLVSKMEKLKILTKVKGKLEPEGYVISEEFKTCMNMMAKFLEHEQGRETQEFLNDSENLQTGGARLFHLTISAYLGLSDEEMDKRSKEIWEMANTLFKISEHLHFTKAWK